MNEKIKELAEQAGFKVNWQHEDVQAIKMARFEKFAELIVKECCDMVSKRPYVDDGVSIYLHPSTIIKRHFGIEE